MREKAKTELIALLKSQVIDLSMMSKIELGDDVIAEIIRLQNIIAAEPKMQLDDELISRIAINYAVNNEGINIIDAVKYGINMGLISDKKENI